MAKTIIQNVENKCYGAAIMFLCLALLLENFYFSLLAFIFAILAGGTLIAAIGLSVVQYYLKKKGN